MLNIRTGTFVIGCMSLLAFQAQARDQMIPLSSQDAAGLSGKSVALTLHERPSFVAMTAGKAGFGLFGVAAMISDGNSLVDNNHIADPVGVVRTQLADMLAGTYGAKPLAADTTPIRATKPDDLAKTHPEADYVLDVRSGGWNYSYFPTKWGTYWVGYGVQVQLIDTKSGRQVSNMACNTNTHENPHPPSREAMVANNAQLLKDITTSFGWICSRLLAAQQFMIPAEKIPAIPTEFVDPLATAAQSSPAPAASGPAEPAKQSPDEHLAGQGEAKNNTDKTPSAPASTPTPQ